MTIRALTALVCGLLATPALAQESRLPELLSASRAAPNDAEAQLAYAKALIKAERLPEAETQMKKVVRLRGGSIEALYEAMRVKFAEGNYRRARAACRDLVKKDKDHVLSHVCMARAFLLWRRASRALEHIDAALAVDPNNVEARLALADARRFEGKWPQARAAYAKVLELRPASVDAYLGLGRIDLVTNDEASARENFSKAYAADPQDPDAQYELGRVSEGTKAVDLLAAAVSARRSWPEAELALAIARLRAGDAKAAEASLRAIVARDPKNPIAIAQLGAALTSLGQFEEAESHLKKALEMIPNDYETSIALARLYERTERHEEAFTQYRNAADLKREDPTPLIEAARLGMRLKRALLAGALLDKALERAPRSAAVLALSGDARFARGDAKAAKDYYRRALAGEGPVDRAHVQKRLSELK